MEKWIKYRRKGVVEARPYVYGEDMTGISLSPEDTPADGRLRGGMILRNPDNHKDMWYVNPDYFDKMYEKE